MEPRIGRSIGEGFRATLRSWPAIGLLIGGWVAVLLIAILCIGVTNPPPELFETAPAADLGIEREPAVSGDEAAGTMEQAREDGTPQAEDLFTQLQPSAADTPAAGADVPEAPLPPPVVVDDPDVQRRQVVDQWFGRAWPMVVLCALVLLAANLWLTGGQIGYLARRLRDGTAPLAAFWQAANRAFVPLLGAAGLLALASGALAIGVALLAAGLGLLGGVLPELVMNLLGLAAGAALFAGMVWLLIRVAAFWFIAVVADGLGPVAGLKAGFRATRKRFWRLFGLGLLALLISLGAGLPFALLEWVGTTLGGGAGGAMGLFSNLLGGLVSLIVGFAVSAAFIRFYLDARAETRG